MEFTLDAVQSLLATCDAGLKNICQATAFVKHTADVEKLRPILAGRGLDEIPIVCVVNDVCRDNLLFEIDATALQLPESDGT